MADAAFLLFGGDFANAIGAVALIAFCALGTIALLQPGDLSVPSSAAQPASKTKPPTRLP